MFKLRSGASDACITAASAAFQWAIDSNHPDVAPKASVSLGLLLQQSGDLRGARRAFESAIDAHHPDATPSAALSLGTLLELQGDEHQARVLYQAAIDSGHVEAAPLAALQSGALLELAGDLEGARAAYTQALEAGRGRGQRRALEALDRLAYSYADAPDAAVRCVRCTGAGAGLRLTPAPAQAPHASSRSKHSRPGWAQPDRDGRSNVADALVRRGDVATIALEECAWSAAVAV